MLLATLLFVVLSPGVLLTIPPIGGKLFLSGKTSMIAVLVHAVIFYLILSMRRQIPVINVIFEGFLNPGDACPKTGGCPAGMTCKNGKCVQLIMRGQSCEDMPEFTECAAGTTCKLPRSGPRKKVCVAV